MYIYIYIYNFINIYTWIDRSMNLKKAIRDTSPQSEHHSCGVTVIIVYPDTYIIMFICMYIDVYICIYVYIYIYVHIYVNMCIFMYTYIYIYIHHVLELIGGMVWHQKVVAPWQI